VSPQDPVVKDLCARYINEYLTRKKPRSQLEDLRQIRAYVLPKLGGMGVAAVAYEDVWGLHKGMRSTPYQANRVLVLLSRLFTLAEIWRIRPYGSNPCRGIRQYTEQSRWRHMTEEEAPRVAAAIEAQAAARPLEVAFLYMVMLSGARPDEVRRARWDWLTTTDAGGVLAFPDSKTGARKVYLSPRLMTLLAALPRSGPLILPGARPDRLWGTVRVQAGVPDLRIYDLRRTFATAALAAGHTIDQIGELLGHKSAQTTKVYARLMSSKAGEIAAGASAKMENMLNQGSLIASHQPKRGGQILKDHTATEPEGDDNGENTVPVGVY